MTVNTTTYFHTRLMENIFFSDDRTMLLHHSYNGGCATLKLSARFITRSL